MGKIVVDRYKKEEIQSFWKESQVKAFLDEPVRLRESFIIRSRQGAFVGFAKATSRRNKHIKERRVLFVKYADLLKQVGPHQIRKLFGDSAGLGHHSPGVRSGRFIDLDVDQAQVDPIPGDSTGLGHHSSDVRRGRFIDLDINNDQAELIQVDDTDDEWMEPPVEEALARRKKPKFVPAELAGRWIVWSKDNLRIVGSGDSPTEALGAAIEPVGPLEYVPQMGKPAGPRAEVAGS